MNPYFKHQANTNPEFNIYRDAAHEIVEQRGLDLIHLKRKIINNDLILGDTLLSEFNEKERITMYMENYTSFEGSDNLFGSFGFEMTDQMVLLVSPLSLENLTNEVEESDILYHELTDRMFEIIDIKDANSFYQFGRDSYWKKIRVKPFNKNHEEFNTGDYDIDLVEDIDDVIESNEDDLFKTARELFLDE